MKKWIFFFSILTLLIVLFALPATVSATVLRFEDAIVMGNSVNMRLGPDTGAPVVTKLTDGARIGVFAEEDGWYRVIFGNYRGYVNKDLVFLASTDTIYGQMQKDVDIFQSPSDYSEKTGEKANAGTGITILNVDGDFFELGDEEGLPVGYVKRDAVVTSNTKKPVTLLKLGMKGVEVQKMQSALRKRGFMSAAATGEFGDKTKDAVKAFQKEAKLTADGVAGAKTLELLYGDNNIKTNIAKKYGILGEVKLVEWDKMNNIFKKGMTAIVTDVRTGIKYKTKRFGGWFHADSEPISSADAANMKKMYGGKWSWDRRAIFVTVGGTTYAASQNGMPHLGSPSKSNDFPGHYCIHFYKSKVHQTSRECNRHQAMVMTAYRSGKA